MKKILVVDDERPISDIIKFNLTKEGYEVVTAFDGREALEQFEAEKPDLVILDLMLPELDGLEVAKEIRKTSHTPIIMLSAKDSEFDKVIGLEIGADDYVTKPFGMMELMSRIKAVLRRSAKGSVSSEDTFEIGEIRLDPKKHEVTVHGEVVNLTLKEYELLKRLMKNSNIVLTRDQLLEDIWGYDFDGETRTVDVHVRTLRQKLGDAGEQIETVRGVGYRMSR
mgnify:CR=1 FL=1